MTNFRRDTLIICSLAVLAVLVGTFSGSASMQHFLTQLLVLGMFASAFDFAFGRSGLFSAGHAAFFGCGAYATALSTLRYDWTFMPSLALAALVGGAIAFVFAVLARRVPGVYFALATLAMAQLVLVITEVKLSPWSGGSDGLAGVPRPILFGVDLGGTGQYLLFVCVVFVIALVTLSLLRHSPYGQVLRAIRENAVRAEQLGYNIDLYRISAFTVSGAYSGVAGGLFGGLIFYVGPDLLRMTLSVDVLVMSVLGGPNTLLGPLLGVAVFETSREVITRYTDHWHGFVGIMFILATLFLPFGLVGLFRARRRPKAEATAEARDFS